MSEPQPQPQRQQVRVRRSPKIGVFLAIGAVLGALAAIIAGTVTPQDSATPKEQAIGYLLLLLAPLGAILGGALALVLDRIGERRAKTVEAERIVPERPVEVQPADADTVEVAAAEAVAEPAVEPEQTDRT